MLLTRLYLRNFRVYEDELDLALPPGLVGIYGANGAGKSTLLEAITFTLWGKARTGRDEIRSAGVGADCVTELEFEHEGHLYLVRRTLSGINATMRAEAHCDGLAMAEGATDTRRYVHSILGMDDVAFRASVFAEQKQLAAFSSQAPAERRRLVLQLLGITPLDGARDAVRRDAREAEGRLTQLRGMLPDLEQLAVDVADADARAASAEKTAGDEVAVAATARQRAAAAAEEHARHDRLRQAREALVIEGRGAALQLEQAAGRVAAVGTELAALEGAADDLAAARAGAAGLEDDRRVLEALRHLADAWRRVDAVVVGDEPAPPDDGPRTLAAGAAEAAAAARARAAGQVAAAAAELERATETAGRSAALSAEADCPVCGQALGDAFEAVQAHRQAEVAGAAGRLDARRAEQAEADAAARTAAATLAAAEAAWEAARRARAAWETQAARRAEAEAQRAEALLAVDAAGGPGPASLADPAAVGAVGRTFAAAVAAKEAVATQAVALAARLERRPELEAELAAARAAVAAAETAVGDLRARVAALGFDEAALEAARRRATDTAAAAAEAEDRAAQARLEAAKLRALADGEERRLADGRAQHAKLADLDGQARHLSRLAVLLSEFRNTVVASVGPRLAAQAAELFAELTDREYDRLEVDPETYELQISDAGRVYGLDRFSGSEIDLANLALRVAISEQVRFQSGGSVGLLVLDEVFGPLDEERKARMLQALEQLRGRFRQILVVTHDPAIKEQLPNAIEVVKRPGRRATAHLLAG